MFQVDRACSSPIETAAWSPTMDLLAISYQSQEVSVVRTCLTWQVVWTIKEEGEGAVLGLAWRNDGKIISVSYRNVVNLHNVEGGTLIHSSCTTDNVITWACVPIPPVSVPHVKPVSVYLPPLEDVKTDITTTRALLETKSDIHLMLLQAENQINFTAQGILHIGSVSTPNISTCGLTSDGEQLCVIDSTPTCHVFNTSVLPAHACNIGDITLIHSKVLTLSEYLLTTLKAMTDTWDDVLSEFNKKLFAFHVSLHPSNLSEQFLHLLVTGTACSDLETFLVHTLKEKDIAQLLQSTMQSYHGIEKLINQNMMSCCYCLSTELNSLLGMSRWYDRYGELGLQEDAVQDTVNALCGLMIKCQELLQCISLSKAKLSAFLKWLLKATISLSEGTNMTVQLSEKELNQVVEFLKGGSLFSTRADTSHFNIDLVWQYFTEENLVLPPQYYNNQILDTILTLLKEKKPYLTVQPSLSLLQSHKIYSDSLTRCFQLQLPNLNTPTHKIDLTGQYALSSDARSIRCVDSNNIITLISISHESVKRCSATRHTIPHPIKHIFGYDKDYILVTTDEAGRSTINICFEDDIVKTLLPPDFEGVFISENRRLGAIVSAQGRRVQIMDLDEDGCEE